MKNEADTAFAGAQKSSNGFFASIGRGLGALVAGAGAIAATVGAIAIGGGISRALNIEDATAKLKGLGHDTKAVDQIMTDALASVKGTAFGLDSAATLAASAVAAGIEPGKELERYLRLTADAATIAGGSMDELGNVMNNVTTVGAAYNDSLQILAQKGLPIYQWLAEELGVTTDAVKQLASEGKISAETFQAAIENNIAGAAMSAGDTTRGAFANVGAALSRLGEVFAGPALSGAKNFFDELIVIIDGIAERIEPAVGGINDQLSGMFQFDGLGERVLGFVDSVTGAFSGIGDAFGGLDGLAPVFGAIVGAMAPLLNTLPIIGKLLPAISGPVGAIIGLIAGLLIESEPLRESLSGLADTIGGALSSAFGGAGESLSSFAPMISEVLEVLGDGLAEGITAITPAIGVLIETLGQVFEALSPLIEPLMGIVTAVLSLLGPIGELIGAILPPLAELFVLIAGSVADLAGTFLEALLPVIEALVGALGGPHRVPRRCVHR
ncbi:MAG: tape measure protein [Actinomycetota bacterium]